MHDLFAALGLAMALEGVAWALFPAAMKRFAATLLGSDEGALRMSGLVVLGLGVLLVWLVRG